MNVQLDLLRHGETERGGGFRGSLDDALTPAGWAQMRTAIADTGPWDRLVSSPLLRCADFARALAAETGVPLHLEVDLRELHFGAWEGRSAAELMETEADALGRFWADPYAFTPPDGEALEAFEARVLTAVQRLARQFAGERLLVITHGGVMRLLLARARGLERRMLLSVDVEHGSLHRLEWPCEAA
ncbi:histidine phosphatase family protein [Pseudomonas indica]|uniref:histidine phosphatase family protein n=1 Tax=Pseudomonas indica TaxID=137658 RepID=UPI0023F68DAA|nr:alpha-ribazole phosphatase family protein [Pseudomonas indica]MBU3059279.1 alpha-ribazole phosphatase family protein [Pseudomonas indica]